MHKLELYSTLGLTRNARRLSMRDNIIKCAEKLHEKGLDSRIPLLKIAFADQKVDTSAIAEKEKGVPIPDWKEGHEIRVSKSFFWMLGRAIFHHIGFKFTLPDEMQKFNIFNMDKGLQIMRFDIPKQKTHLFVVCQCETKLVGDLRVTLMPIDILRRITDANAAYIPHLNQIIMDKMLRDDESLELWLGASMTHELEHAAHYNLCVMSGFSTDYLPSREREYLSMLNELRIDYSVPILLGALPPFNNHNNIIQVPHKCASFLFVSRLMDVYGMTYHEIEYAVAPFRDPSKKVDDLSTKNFKKILDCARKEYELTYEKFFGLTREDIKEIIANLPLI